MGREGTKNEEVKREETEGEDHDEQPFLSDINARWG